MNSCVNCNHVCHCIGKGNFKSLLVCAFEDRCECTNCEHKTKKGEAMINWIKKQWKKFIDWVFDGFYK